jgi:hypothetical protein
MPSRRLAALTAIIGLIASAQLPGMSATATTESPTHVPGAPTVGAQQDPPQGAVTEGYTVRVLNSRGRSKNTPENGRNGGIDIPLFDLVTGRQVGTAHHNFFCMPPAYCQDVDTYVLPEGTLTVAGNVSVMPDPQGPDGWVMVHTPQNVHQLEGTGIFANRSGWVRTTGRAKVDKYPAEVELDEVHIIAYK